MIELLDLQRTLHAFAACNDDDEVYASFGWLHAAFCAGEMLDRRRAQAIKDDFDAIGARVQVRGFKPFPWMDAPVLR